MTPTLLSLGPCPGAVIQYQEEFQLCKLNAEKDVIDVKVVRGGETTVKSSEVVVGDILPLSEGDKIVADGLVIESDDLAVDEASFTGEAGPVGKDASDPWCRAGTQVARGSGKLLVTAVGDASDFGKTMSLLSFPERTPLQEKLAHVAALVGNIGLTLAVTYLIALLIKWCVVNRGFPLDKACHNGPVQFFLNSVTIIVVAIPEGLPLAVTLALAYSVRKTMKGQNYVRVLAACETMGGATAMCVDKTGVLTENSMAVTDGWFGGRPISHAGRLITHAPAADEIDPGLRQLLELGIALNSTASLTEHGRDLVTFVGNRTECALLMLGRKWGANYQRIRDQHDGTKDVVQRYEFTSARKMSSVLLRTPDNLLLLNKGAAEWVLQKCSNVALAASTSGAIETQPLDDATRAELIQVIVGMATKGLRCISLAVRQLSSSDESRQSDFFDNAENVEQQMTLVAIVGIKDHVRDGVPATVRKCHEAGITVRMVTGDNIHTARQIAEECGILTEDGVVLEGPNFRTMPIQEVKPLLPKLQVLARSSPQDKLYLVSLLRHAGEVVATTGAFRSDVNALREADVGLAMEKSGSEVAKEAADIILLDDKFTSIDEFVSLGRSVFTFIRKFLQYQLTVNFVAIIVSVVGASVGGRMPLNVLQLLWVNLIMDTLVAFALAIEAPSPKLLQSKPAGHTEPLINEKMLKHIVMQSCYQIFWLLLILYGAPTLLSARYGYTPQCDLYARECESSSLSHGMSRIDSERFCGYITMCGQPCGSTGSTNGLCPTGGDIRAAVCPDEAGECAALGSFRCLQSTLERSLVRHHDEEFMKIASLLFNIFIFAQIFNIVNSRRINDEYNVFEGLYKSALSLTLIAAIVGCQVAIMKIGALSNFFKVQPLEWDEWLVSIAIGVGGILWSMAVRFLSRNISFRAAGDVYTKLCSILARAYEAKPRNMVAAHDIYTSEKLSVQQAVGLALAKAAAEGQKAKNKVDKHKRCVGTSQKCTWSHRGDSAGSLDNV
eukprot:GHUV01010478.1.p1 GENE.GHUV01010478.1~~GHUV01010478.1.p1  ORF type:complete len:1008 (+),score=247.34 GHUV01010478.1:318-3341(+)